LFTAEFASGLERTLKPGAKALVMTDVIGLFGEICATLRDAGLKERPWERDCEDAAQSSYERKYRRQSRRFYSAAFERVSR
jgi:tRNA G46 methylase TrmB